MDIEINQECKHQATFFSDPSTSVKPEVPPVTLFLLNKTNEVIGKNLL